VKEDVSDIISNISPTKTPFVSLIGSEKPMQTLHSWQEDSLRSVDLGNARIEGQDPTVDNGPATLMRHTYVQHMDRAIKVSDISDIVSKYGRNKELAYRLSKASAELKRGLEAILLSGQTGTAGSSSVAPMLDSYQAQIDAEFRVATGGAATMPTEAQLLTTLQGLYTEGADPTTILVSPAYSVQLTTFSKAAGRYREIPNAGPSSKAIVNAVELFVSPFGQQEVVIDRFSLSTDTFIFDPANWKLLPLVNWTKEELAKTGRATTVQIYGTFGLKHVNQKASAVIRTVTGTVGPDGVARF
jgi:hypothetical protein